MRNEDINGQSKIIAEKKRGRKDGKASGKNSETGRRLDKTDWTRLPKMSSKVLRFNVLYVEKENIQSDTHFTYPVRVCTVRAYSQQENATTYRYNLHSFDCN